MVKFLIVVLLFSFSARANECPYPSVERCKIDSIFRHSYALINNNALDVYADVHEHDRFYPYYAEGFAKGMAKSIVALTDDVKDGLCFHQLGGGYIISHFKENIKNVKIENGVSFDNALFETIMLLCPKTKERLKEKFIDN